MVSQREAPVLIVIPAFLFLFFSVGVEPLRAIWRRSSDSCDHWCNLMVCPPHPRLRRGVARRRPTEHGPISAKCGRVRFRPNSPDFHQRWQTSTEFDRFRQNVVGLCHMSARFDQIWQNWATAGSAMGWRDAWWWWCSVWALSVDSASGALARPGPQLRQGAGRPRPWALGFPGVVHGGLWRECAQPACGAGSKTVVNGRTRRPVSALRRPKWVRSSP